MSENLRNCIGKLQYIAAIKNKRLRSAVLNDICDDCLYKAVHEIALNVTKNNVKLSLPQKKKLFRRKKLIKALATLTKSKKRRKNLLVQSGGFLPILIPSIVAALGSLIK